MTIYLIRHGQSEFNAAHRDGEPDPMLWDAPLTELGQQQALQARVEIADLGVIQVITSPLTRAIQTAKLIFDGIAPIRVMAEHRELVCHSCDVGRGPTDLQSDFPELGFDHLDPQWWFQGPVNENGVAIEPDDVFQKRIRDFAALLGQISDRPLAVVGHGNSFRELAGFDMQNCEIRQYP